MASWFHTLKKHINEMGTFWTNGTMERYSVVSDKEKKTLLRKRQLLKDRKSNIVQAIVEAKILRVQTFDDIKTVTYLCYLKFLIKQDKFFYIEESIQERKARLRGDELLSDEEVFELPETKIEFVEDQEPQRGKSSSKYNRLEVVKYADQWWNRYNPNYRKFENDCTNYVSQCLHAGDLPMNGQPNRGSGWWYNSNSWSYSWSVANAMRWCLSGKGGIQAKEVEKAQDLVPGDVICYDFEGDGKWNHTTVVTDKDFYGMPLVNAHTINSRHRYWSYEDSPAYTSKIKYKYFKITD